MTGEVINFPTKTVRDWLIIERAMNESLLESQLSPPAQARLVERMKSFYETLQLDFNFTISPSPEGRLVGADCNALKLANAPPD
jgi:hypothetical protein